MAVVSDALWRTRFGADPRIVGRSITLNDRAFTVVGVMPPEFRGLSFDTDVWVPMMMLTGRPTAFQWGEIVVSVVLSACAWLVADSYHDMAPQDARRSYCRGVDGGA